MKQTTCCVLIALTAILFTVTMGKAQTFNLKTRNLHQSVQKNTYQSCNSIEKNEFLDSINTISATAKYNKIKELRKALKVTVDNDSVANLLYKQIQSVKSKNSHDFLSDYKDSWFNIFKIRNYQVDTINAYLYQQTQLGLLSNVSLQNLGSSDNFINAEFGSYLFGPVKLDLCGTFKTTGDTTKDKAIKTSLQKIVSNGGSLNLNFTAPILIYRSMDEQFHFGIFAQVNNAINPSINDFTGKTSYSSDNLLLQWQAGFIFHTDVTSNYDQKAKLSFEMPVLYSFGNNNIGIGNFYLIKLKAGLVVRDLLNLSLSGTLWSSSKNIQNIPITMSLGFPISDLIKTSTN